MAVLKMGETNLQQTFFGRKMAYKRETFRCSKNQGSFWRMGVHDMHDCFARKMAALDTAPSKRIQSFVGLAMAYES